MYNTQLLVSVIVSAYKISSGTFAVGQLTQFFSHSAEKVLLLTEILNIKY